MGLHPRGREGSLRPTGSGVVAPRRYGRVAEVVRTARSWRAWRCARLSEWSRVEVGRTRRDPRHTARQVIVWCAFGFVLHHATTISIISTISI